MSVPRLIPEMPPILIFLVFAIYSFKYMIFFFLNKDLHSYPFKHEYACLIQFSI